MRIYDEGIFFSHLEIEVAKSVRFGYPFSVIAIKPQNHNNYEAVFMFSILEANYRNTDVVARIEENTYLILLNGTSEKDAQNYMVRLVHKCVAENEVPIMTAVTSFQNCDTPKNILKRLIDQLK